MCNYLATVKEQWRAHMNTKMNPRVQQMVENFLTTDRLFVLKESSASWTSVKVNLSPYLIN
jgi:hypothetical protein